MTFNGIDDVLNANLNYVWDGSTWVAETQPGAAAGSTQVSVTGLTFDTSNALNVKLDGSTALSIGSVAAGAGRLNIGSTAADNAVLTTPVSTAFIKLAGLSIDTSNALNVKLDGSTALTIGSIAAGAGRMNIGSTAADNAVTATILAGSTLATRPLQSSQADLRMTAYQSSAAELKVTIYQSSAAELMNKSWTLDGITGAGIESSTFAASTRTSTARGLVTRAAIPDCTSATARLATAGDNAILTSAATTIHVYALSFSAGLPSTGTSTGSSGVVVQLQAGTTGARLWTFNWQASSNGEGPHEAIAVTPPAYLFRTGAGGSLNAAAGSSGGYISVAAWRE